LRYATKEGFLDTKWGVGEGILIQFADWIKPWFVRHEPWLENIFADPWGEIHLNGG